METCPIHKTPMVCFCPKCRGSKGGAQMTPKQLARNRKAAKAKSRQAKRRMRERRRPGKAQPMNSRQQRLSLDGHDHTIDRKIPGGHMIGCLCGWRVTIRNRNALARASKAFGAWNDHVRAAIAKATQAAP